MNDEQKSSITDERCPRFNVPVQLSGEDGNAFAVIGRVHRVLREAGATPAEMKEFMDEALSGNYDHVLQTCMAWVDVQ